MWASQCQPGPDWPWLNNVINIPCTSQHKMHISAHWDRERGELWSQVWRSPGCDDRCACHVSCDVTSHVVTPSHNTVPGITLSQLRISYFSFNFRFPSSGSGRLSRVLQPYLPELKLGWKWNIKLKLVSSAIKLPHFLSAVIIRTSWGGVLRL